MYEKRGTERVGRGRRKEAIAEILKVVIMMVLMKMMMMMMMMLMMMTMMVMVTMMMMKTQVGTTRLAQHSNPWLIQVLYGVGNPFLLT